MPRKQLNLQDSLATLGIKDTQQAYFTVEADDANEDLHFNAAEFDAMISYLQEVIADGKSLILSVLWDSGSDYFDLSSQSKSADQFLIDLLVLQGWQVIC